MENTIKKYSLLPFLIALYVTALILRPILAVKIFSFHSIKVPAGILVFPLSFICNDIFTEIYGYRLSKNIIRAGLFAQILSCFVITISIIIPGASFWSFEEEYKIILGQNFRFAAASMIACYMGEIVNSIVLSKMKYSYREDTFNLKFQSYRFVVSTIFGEMVDSIIYVTVGFAGNLDNNILLNLIISTWIIKSLYEILLLPVSLSITNRIKDLEQIDVIDKPMLTKYSLI
jgi:uncharacterized integral membrane protein (TIGR00697 family)